MTLTVCTWHNRKVSPQKRAIKVTQGRREQWRLMDRLWLTVVV